MAEKKYLDKEGLAYFWDKTKSYVEDNNDVYVGTTEPTDSQSLIWINPDGEASDSLATKSYVDEAIAAIKASQVSYDNTTSNLSTTQVQSTLDYLATQVDGVETLLASI